MQKNTVHSNMPASVIYALLVRIEFRAGEGLNNVQPFENFMSLTVQKHVHIEQSSSVFVILECV